MIRDELVRLQRYLSNVTMRIIPVEINPFGKWPWYIRLDHSPKSHVSVCSMFYFVTKGVLKPHVRVAFERIELCIELIFFFQIFHQIA